MVSPHLRDVYEGYFSLPKSAKGADLLYKTWVIEVKSSRVEGQLTSISNHNNQRDDKCHYENEEHTTYVIEFPYNIKDLFSATAIIVINLKVNITGKDDFVTVNRGAPYFASMTYTRTGRLANFTVAKQRCNERGGVLATITSEKEKSELFDRMQNCIECKGNTFWLGARRKNGVWSWIDSGLWNQNLSIDNNIQGNCLTFRDGRIQPDKCTDKMHVICKLEETTFRQNTSVTFQYPLESLNHVPKLRVYHFSSTPGSPSSWFSIDWNVVNGSKGHELKTNSAIGRITLPHHKEKYSFVLDLPDVLDFDGFVEITTPVGYQTSPFRVEYNILQKSFEKNKKKGGIGTDTMTWANAERTCSEIGGNLPSVHSKSELKALSEELSIDNPTDGA